MILIIVFKNKHNYYTASISTHPPPSPVKNCVWALLFYFFFCNYNTFSMVCTRQNMLRATSAGSVQDRTCYKQHLQDLYKTEHVTSNICRICTRQNMLRATSAGSVQDRACYEQHLQDLYKTEHVTSNICRICTRQNVLRATSAGSGPARNCNVILSRGKRAFSSPETVSRQSLKPTSGTPPTSYLIGNRRTSSRSNMAREWSCLLTSIQYQSQE